MPEFQFWLRKERYPAATNSEVPNLHKKSRILH